MRYSTSETGSTDQHFETRSLRVFQNFVTTPSRLQPVHGQLRTTPLLQHLDNHTVFLCEPAVRHISNGNFNIILNPHPQTSLSAVNYFLLQPARRYHGRSNITVTAVTSSTSRNTSLAAKRGNASPEVRTRGLQDAQDAGDKWSPVP